jgi:uncharacterized protein YidB (DUF937 family)
MGLLDSVIGAVASNMGGGGQQSGLMNVVMGMLANQQGGQGGGLGSLVSLFQEKGAGDLMSSWVGTGQNMPISADQLTSILGSDKIGAIASQLGMSQGDASGALANLLPQVIDKLTPDGQMPQGDVSGQLSGLLGGLFKK